MRVGFHRQFAKSFKRCPAQVQKQFKKRFRLFLAYPHHPLLGNHALHGEWKDHRSINITGDYRALYCHLDSDLVEFFIIDTHSNLYG